MVTQLIRQKIAAAVGSQQGMELLAERLGQIGAEQGQEMSPEAIRQIVGVVRDYVESTPNLLEACAFAANQAGVGGFVMPILEVAAGYFMEPMDFIPDHFGLYGLLDDAYLTQNLLAQISGLYQQQTGMPLLPISLDGANQIVRGIIGEPLAGRLDQAVAQTIQTAIVQQSLGQLAAQPGTLDFSGYSPTGGPGSWGGCVEDEIARIGAECGISINY